MARIEITVTVTRIYETSRAAFGGYKSESFYIYTFADEAGQVYVWKTTAFAGLESEDPAEGWIIRGDTKYRFDGLNKGDVITIRATVKGQSEYKGQPQTEISRVKVLSRSVRGKTYAELQAEREAEREHQKQEQLAGLAPGDWIWHRMPYKQYKDHYADCETVLDSFDRQNGNAYVDVIIREGRLKYSGTRGRHYAGYEYIWTEDGHEMRQAFYAISEETAYRRLLREHPTAEDIKAGQVYRYFRNY